MQEYVISETKKIIDELGDAKISELFNGLTNGKMLRAKLILEIGGKKALRLAAIVELIHLASLLHDDVIDHSKKRRGKPTINAIYGEHTAIMLGDILYSKAFAELVLLDFKVASKIALAVSTLSIGELADVALSANFNANAELYLQMIYNKTASLIEASCYGAAIIGKLDADAFGMYGKSLGIAFQLIDDLLDIFGDETILGKPALSDLKEGKTTIAYIKLFDAMDSDEKLHLKELFKKQISEDEKIWLFDRFKKYNIKQICEDAAANTMTQGLNAIQDTNANIELKTKLKEIAIKQLGRTF